MNNNTQGQYIKEIDISYTKMMTYARIYANPHIKIDNPKHPKHSFYVAYQKACTIFEDKYKRRHKPKFLKNLQISP